MNDGAGHHADVFTPAATYPRRSILVAVAVGTAALAFAAANGQAPLYYSNQNQYFLHGMAAAGHGQLSQDWLAGTIDPTPVFSALVKFTFRHLHPWAFYVYFGLLQTAYALAMLGLFAFLAGKQTAAARWPVFAAGLVFIHSVAIQWFSEKLRPYDFFGPLISGLAEQTVLDSVLQPSAFGVLLVVSLCLFVRDRPLLAGACVALAADVHATYLLPSGLLTLGYLAALMREGRWRLALGVGALALAVVLPGALFAVLTFGPTTPETYAEGQSILVNFRIPHHARPSLWLHKVAIAQILWVVLGVVLAWPTRLFFALLVPLAGAVLLTGLQMATDSLTLALIFPWRISSILVPVATTVILTRIIALPVLPLQGAAVRVSAAIVMLVLAVVGVWLSATAVVFRFSSADVALMEFARTTSQEGDVYFLPMEVPNLLKSWDFPDNFQRFRLKTGVPIFVDFKSIPYKDVEVREWRTRLQFAEEVRERIRQGRLAEAAAELRRRGVTHLVQPASQPLTGPWVREIYQDANYRVYRLIGK